MKLHFHSWEYNKNKDEATKRICSKCGVIELREKITTTCYSVIKPYSLITPRQIFYMSDWYRPIK